MKKYLIPLLLALFCLPLFCACKKKEPYLAHLSEIRSDIFIAEDEEFKIELCCVSREYPYQADGIAAPRSDLIEISLKGAPAEYSVYLSGEEHIGGDMSFRNTRGDYFYSQGVKSFPQNSVSVCVEKDGDVREICATSVKNSNTISVESALSSAIRAEADTVENMKRDGVFTGEFYVRLLRRDKNYYYVGIINENGKTISLLLDSETGEVLARRA